MFSNMKIRTRLILGFTLVLVIGSVGGIVGLSTLKHLGSEMGVARKISHVAESALQMQVNALLCKSANDKSYLEKVKTQQREVDGLMVELKVEAGSDEEAQALINSLGDEIDSWGREFLNFQEEEGSVEALGVSGEIISHQVSELFHYQKSKLQDFVMKSVLGMIATLFFALIIGIIAAFFMSRSITRPLSMLVDQGMRMARGELVENASVNTRKDEIGILMDAVREVNDYLVDVRNISAKIAQGNLDVRVTPRSDADVFSKTYLEMITYLKQVAQAADAVATGDLSFEFKARSDEDLLGKSLQVMIHNLSELALGMQEAAEQIAAASEEISGGAQANAQGAQQIAMGAERQAATVEQITGVSKEVNTSTEEVGKNTEAQVMAMENLGSVVVTMNESLQNMADNSRTVAKAAQGAEEEAKAGGEALRQVIDVMGRI